MQEFKITAAQVQALTTYIEQSIPAIPVFMVAELQRSLRTLPPIKPNPEFVHAPQVETAASAPEA